MKFFAKKTLTAKEEPQLASAQPALQGLTIQLNQNGKISALSPALLELLGITSAPLGQHIAELLQTQFSWSALPLAEWPEQAQLEFKQASGNRVQLQATVLGTSSDWYLVLTEPQSSNLQEQAKLLTRELSCISMRHTQKLNTVSGTLLKQIANDWLESIAVAVQAPWATLAIAAEQHASIEAYATYIAPGAHLPMLSLSEIEHTVRSSGHSTEPSLGYQVVHISNIFAQEFFLILPTGRVESKTRQLSDEDWKTILSLFAPPFASQLQQQQTQQKIHRNVEVDSILDAGWWQYSAEQDQFLLCSGFAQRLGVNTTNPSSCALSGEDFARYLTPLDSLQFQNAIKQAIKHGKPFDLKIQIKKHAVPTWFRVLAFPQKTAGPYWHLNGYAINVEKQKEAEESANLAQNRLEKLIHNAPAVIYTLSYNDGHYKHDFCSSSIQSILGWSVEQVRNTKLGSFIHEDDRNDYYQGLRTLLTAGSITRRYRILDVHGNYRWVLDESRVLHSEEGLPKEISGLFIDINDNVIATAKLKASEERYRQIVEDSPAIILRYTPTLDITYGNKQFYKSLGMASVDQHNSTLNLSDLLDAEAQEPLLGHLAQSTAEQANAVHEVKLKLSEHNNVWWAVSEHAIFNEAGELIEFQAVANDTTAIRNAQESMSHSAKMASLGKIATSLAHEISQPLTVINMTLSNISRKLAKQEATPEYIQSKVQRLQEQAERTSKVISHMSQFGRKPTLDMTEFQPNLSLDNVMLLMKNVLATNKVTVTRDDQPTQNCSLLGHPDLFEQTLINILANAQYAALKNASARPAEIKITTQLIDNTFELRVLDSGTGIPQDILSRIFEPFVTSKPSGEGTGIGLSLCQDIMKNMGGDLAAGNHEGGGAWFKMSLPVHSQVTP